MNAKPLYLGSNASPLEIIKYGTDEQVRELLSSDTDGLAEKEKELEQTEKRLELIEEQLYFSHELLEVIEQAMKTETRAKDLKKAIKCAIENSMLER